MGKGCGVSMDFNGKFFNVRDCELVGLREIYPSVNVILELRLMDNWLETNPRRRKKNYPRFIANWLRREERRACALRKETTVGASPCEGATVKKKYLDLERERLEASSVRNRQ